MAEFIYVATEEEKQAVVKALVALNAIRHLNYMSQATISEESGVKATKVRAALEELIKEKAITQYVIDEMRSVKRYYYVVEPLGREKYFNGVVPVI